MCVPDAGCLAHVCVAAVAHAIWAFFASVLSCVAVVLRESPPPRTPMTSTIFAALSDQDCMGADTSGGTPGIVDADSAAAADCRRAVLPATLAFPTLGSR